MCSWANTMLWVGMNSAKEYFSVLPSSKPALSELCSADLYSFLYSSSSCYLHPQAGSATSLLITLAWVIPKQVWAPAGWNLRALLISERCQLLFPDHQPRRRSSSPYRRKLSQAWCSPFVVMDSRLLRVVTWAMGSWECHKLTQENLIFKKKMKFG